MADRIHACAVRCCGELLTQIPDAKGRNQHTEDQAGALPTRSEAATAAGLSEHQRKTAIRVAAVPASELEAAVESAEPPTVTVLADAGKKPRPLVNLAGSTRRTTRGQPKPAARFAGSPSSARGSAVTPQSLGTFTGLRRVPTVAHPGHRSARAAMYWNG